MKKIMSATQARQQFFKVIQHVEKPGMTVTLTVNGNAKVVMMAYEDYEGWMETLEIMQDKPLMKDIAKALKSKKLITWEEAKKNLDL